MIGRRDGRALGLLAASVAAALAPVLFRGCSWFWGDLSYLNFPWRALAATSVTAGRVPLWNPYTYLGMPLLGNFQCGALYAGSLPFYLLPFASGLKLYVAGHLLLAGVMTFLWLRSLGQRRIASLMAASSWALGGLTMSHLPFLNHLGSLCWFPAFFLFARRPLALGAAFGLCLADGYPVFAAGELLAAFVLSPWLAPHPRRSARPSWPAAPFAAGGLAGAALAAAMLLPSAELTLRSVRAAGLTQDVTLAYSFAWGDFAQFLGPLVLGSSFSPALNWWRTTYWGLAPLAAAGLGAWTLLKSGLEPAVPLALYALAALGLALGKSAAVSAWLWTHLPPLKFVRYPGNLLFLLLPVLAYATARGGGRLRRPALWWLLGAAELVLASWWGQPLVPDSYYRDAGPLVARLQDGQKGNRYILSPLALDWHRGEGPNFLQAVHDFKHRLYGLTNAPFHLAAVGNFGEPLVPGPDYAWMDFLFQRPGLDALAPYMPLAGVSAVLTRDRYPSESLAYEGRTLWHVYRYPGPVSRAWLSARPLPEELGAPSGVLQPLAYAEPREDRFEVSGEGPAGWIYVSNPLYPGWKGWLNGRPLEPRRAYGAFMQFPHAGGALRAVFRYEPASWAWGLAVALAALFGLGGTCYNELIRAAR